jgi:Cys-tRNA(Pro) deacylase
MSKAPSTPAVRLLKAQKVPFTEHLYRYEDHGGTRVSAQELGVDEHAVVKTLIMEDETGKPLMVLMHGHLEVSTKALARQVGAKAIHICKPEVANRHSGYLVGGTSPFGTKKPMPVYVEASILALERIYLNGGSRGFLVGLAPADLLAPTAVSVGIAE